MHQLMKAFQQKTISDYSPISHLLVGQVTLPDAKALFASTPLERLPVGELNQQPSFK